MTTRDYADAYADDSENVRGWAAQDAQEPLSMARTAEYLLPLRVIELSEENDGLTADLVRVMAERDAALATLAKVAAIVAEPGCHPRTDRIRAALVEPTS